MDTLFEILVSNALVAAVPGVMALAAARWVRRPALTHALWLLALLKLVTPPVVDVRVPVLRGEVERAAGGAVSYATVARGAESDPAGVGVGSDVAVIGADGASDGAKPQAAEAPAPFTVPWVALFGGAWVVGAVVTLGVTVVRLARFNRLLRHAVPASRAVQAQADQVARHLGLRRSPRVMIVPGAVSPMLWAVGSRPRLLLPIDLWGQLDGPQRAALLAHELAHFRRRDHWVRYLELAVSVVYWWHPLVWVSRRALRAAEEECCDAWVVDALPGHARAYATALLDTVDFVSTAADRGGARVPLAASAGVGGAAELKRRLVMIMSKANPKSMSSLARVAVLALGLVVLPAVPRLASADDVAKPREAGERDGERPKEGARDGERPKDGPRDGERPREGGRDGERPREGGERSPAGPVSASGSGTFVRMERGAMLLSDDANDKDVRIAVRDNARLMIDGRPGSWRELRPGMMVKATTGADGVTALDVTRPRWLKAGGEGEMRREGGDRPRGEGEIRREGGDRPRGEGEVRREGGDRPRGEGEVRREGGDRPRGEGEVRRDGDKPRGEGEVRRDGGERPRGEGEARRDGGERANVSRPQLRGILERLDGTALVLGVGEGGQVRTIPTEAETKVRVNGEAGKLSDLKPGMLVEVRQVEGITTEVEARAGRR